MRVLRADGAAARQGIEGTLLGESCTGEIFPLAPAGWHGRDWPRILHRRRDRPGQVPPGARSRAIRPGVFTSSPGNIFAGRDVTAVALQIPDADLGGTRIAVWVRISLFGHASQLQVSRIGQAMLRPLFFSPQIRNPRP